jgi:hypothetical protein
MFITFLNRPNYIAKDADLIRKIADRVLRIATERSKKLHCDAHSQVLLDMEMCQHYWVYFSGTLITVG